MSFDKNSLRPQKSTLIRLIQSHRQDAKEAKDEISKQRHWDMAFDYVKDLRKYYGSNHKPKPTL